MRNITGAGLLFGELVNENGDANGVDSLGGDEEVVVIFDDQAEKNESGHGGDHRQKSLHLRRLPAHPRRHRVDRLPRSRSLHILTQTHSLSLSLTRDLWLDKGRCLSVGLIN